MINIAVLGHGVVGSGVVEVFYKNRVSIQKKAGCEMDIKYILDVRDFVGHPYEEKFTKDFEQILNDDSVKIVAEVIGGLDPAYRFVKTCLERGKSVVTSNKELVAAKGAELLALAQKSNVNFFFEASVGGGIPIIRPLHQCLAANEIDEIAGILNGTTNFILTKMFREGMAFETALRLAQELGYAERNPAADVEGHDACRKICILAALSFGAHVYPASVHTEGITAITPEDVQYASSWGGVIKLIGRAKRLENGQIAAIVSPAFIGNDSQLSSVDDVFNGILVRGDATGDVVFYGKGAGKLPTASAVVADIIECAKASETSRSLKWMDSDSKNVAPYEQYPTAMYVRCSHERGDTIQNMQKLMGETTQLHRPEQPENEFAFVTSVAPEGEIVEKLQRLRGDGFQILSTIRILEY